MESLKSVCYFWANRCRILGRRNSISNTGLNSMFYCSPGFHPQKTRWTGGPLGGSGSLASCNASCTVANLVSTFLVSSPWQNNKDRCRPVRNWYLSDWPLRLRNTQIHINYLNIFILRGFNCFFSCNLLLISTSTWRAISPFKRHYLPIASLRLIIDHFRRSWSQSERLKNIY